MNDIPRASSLFVFFLNFVEWLDPVIYLAGLAVAVWAFIRSRKWGYLVVAFYFAFVLFSLLAMPSINRAIRARHVPDISEQTQKKMDLAVQEAIDRVFQEAGHPVMAQKQTIHFPLGPIVLVAGLWFIARLEPLARRSSC